MKLAKLATCIGIAALSACTHDEKGAILFELEGGQGIAMVSSLRTILSTKTVDQETKKETSILCAEPSPDSFRNTQTDSSVGASTNLLNERKTEVIANRLRTTNESDALNVRDVTIQLLRDGLYRACEGYAAGALSNADYADMVRQYQSVAALLHSTTLLHSLVANTEISGTDREVNSREDITFDSMDPSADSSVTGPIDSMDIAELIRDLTIKVLDIGYRRTLIAEFRRCIQTLLSGERDPAILDVDDKIDSAVTQRDGKVQDDEPRTNSTPEQGASTENPAQSDEGADQNSAGEGKHDKRFDCNRLLDMNLRHPLRAHAP